MVTSPAQSGSPGGGGAEFEAALQAVIAARQEVAGAPDDLPAQLRLAERLGAVATLHGRRASAGGTEAGTTAAEGDRAVVARRDAVAAWQEVVRLAPQDAGAHAGLGRALAALASLENRLGAEPEMALAVRREAAGAFDEALRLAPGDAESHTRRGALHSAIGLSLHRDGRYEAALESYQAALKDFQAAQEAGAAGAANLNEGGWVLVRVASAEGALGRHADAVASLEAAIGIFAESRRAEPAGSFGPMSQGQTYAALGDLQATSTGHASLTRGAAGDSTAQEIQRSAIYSRLQKAIASYAQALTCFDDALRLDPGGAAVINAAKAETLQCLAELQAAVARPAEAVATYAQALALYDGPLQANTSSFQYQLGRGRTLVRMGELAGTPEAAASHLRAAAVELSREVPADEPSQAERARLLDRARAGEARPGG